MYDFAYCISVLPPHSFMCLNNGEIKIATSYVVVRGISDQEISIFYDYIYQFPFMWGNNGIRDCIVKYNSEKHNKYEFRKSISIILKNLSNIGYTGIYDVSTYEYRIYKIDKPPHKFKLTIYGWIHIGNEFPPCPIDIINIPNISVSLSSENFVEHATIESECITDDKRTKLLLQN